jgi:hypothetical protein
MAMATVLIGVIAHPTVADHQYTTSKTFMLFQKKDNLDLVSVATDCNWSRLFLRCYRPQTLAKSEGEQDADPTETDTSIGSAHGGTFVV